MRMPSAIAALFLLFFALPAMAQDWTQVWAAGAPLTNLTSVACSADGTKLGKTTMRHDSPPMMRTTRKDVDD